VTETERGARLVAGVDTSTQSCKVVVCDVETGRIVREARAPHPDGTEVDPAAWWTAFEAASGDGLLDRVEAIAVGGQQHGMVTLDGDGEVVRPALLWNDNRSAEAAIHLTAELGGAEAWAAAVGTTLVPSITITKLRWLAEHEPDAAERVAAVMLPHDWLTHRLAAGPRTPTTDRGDASGTGYWSPGTGDYRPDLLELAFGRIIDVPRVAEPHEVVGETTAGALIGPGTGDNMAAALGLGAGPGDVGVSLGTSGVVFAVADRPSHDPSGAVAGFADATGHFLPLVCTLNAARVFDATAAMLGCDLEGLSTLALQAAPGSGGVTLLPYLDGERTPTLPDATGSLLGLRRDNMTPANIARSAIEGVLGGLAFGLDAIRAQGFEPRRLLLLGGAARSPAVRAVAATLFGLDVLCPEPAEYVAIGAARQAAWVLTGSLPDWPVAVDETVPAADPAAGAPVLAAHAAWLDRVHGVPTP
jgi:xylulokinase